MAGEVGLRGGDGRDHGGVLAIRMNDAAAYGLGVLDGAGVAPPVEGISERLKEMLAEGVELRDDAVLWRGGAWWAALSPGDFPDLTGWECFINSFHLHEVVPVERQFAGNGDSWFSDEDQVVLLRHGVAFALEICRMVAGLDPRIALRCVVAATRTNGTFRFHRVREGESWASTDLNDYRSEKVVVVDMEPAL